MASFLITVRCNYCSRHFAPSELTRFSSEVRICQKCRDRHEQAVDALCGKREPECQGCQKSLTDLASAAGADSVPMFVHHKDGIYQLLCRTCSDTYEQKRRDLYANTPYGQMKGIA